MQTDLARALTRLAEGELLRLEGLKGHAVAVFSGHLWITQDDDCRDIFVRGGETFALERNARVIVEALEPTSLLLFDATAAERAGSASATEFERGARTRRSGSILSAFARGISALARSLRRAVERARLESRPVEL